VIAEVHSAGEGGERSVVAVAPGVSLRRATGCFRDLNWDLVLEGVALDWGRVVAALAAVGWTQTSHLEGLAAFALPSGDQVVVVPRSEWIQLRVSYLSTSAERRGRVAHLAGALLAHLGAAGAVTGR
jgi:hypothetical protein